VLYGFSSRLLEHMALKATQPNAATRFSLEDVFVAGDADKLAWVSGWRKLPHVPRDVVKLFEYPQRFAEEAFARIERAVGRRAAGAESSAAARNGRLFIVPNDAQPGALSSIPELPVQFVVSSDRLLSAANKAVACEETQLLHGRTEGEFVVSYKTSAGWVAVTKDVLTEVLGAERDAKVVGLPNEAAHVAKLMCTDLATLL
jgi:hypothetical protein